MAKTLIIKTKMDNSDLQRQYQKLSKDIEIALKEQDQINKKAEELAGAYEQSETALSDMRNTAKSMYDEMNRLYDKANSSKGLTGTETQELERIEKAYPKINAQLEKQYNTSAKIQSQIEQQALKQEKNKNKVQQLNSKLDKTNQKIQEADKNAAKVDFSKANSDLSGTIKKVGKWALAIFGVRTAYQGIRQAISYVSQYNDEMANKIESIKYTLAMALEPVLTKIVDLAYRLVQYIQYVAKAWTGKDIFAGAAKNLKSGSKSAKEIKKSMAGFDTANVLSDSSSGSTGGVGGVLPTLEEGDVPEWVKWISEHGEELTAILVGVGAAMLAIKLTGDLILGLGFGLILAGIVVLVQGILDFIESPTWQNFLTILEGIALVVAGIALLFGGWIVALVALGVALVAYVIKNWDKVKEILGVVGKWCYDHVIKPIADFFVGLWNGIKKTFSAVGTFFKDVFLGAYNGIKSVFSGVYNFFKGIFDKVVSIFKNIGSAAGSAFKSIFSTIINGLLTGVENVLNTPIKAINGLLDIINAVPGVSLKKLSTFKLPRMAVGGIINNPGKGVPVGAIAGEAGREGVIPLTDNQAMEQLGREIGRWINLNVDLTTKLDGRVLSRQLEKVKADNSFIRNGV